VLVTGAAGFIGSHLADRFYAAGNTVQGVDNYQTGQNRGEWAILRGDVAAPDFTRFAADFNPDIIIHCAASYDDRDKWHRDTNTNVNGAINVAIAARESSARVVYFQTALIYGNNPYSRSVAVDGVRQAILGDALSLDTQCKPENSYAISKYAAGQYLRHAGVPLLELRLANIYGPRNLSGPIPTFYKRLSNGENCTIVDSRRDFVYIQDLVELVDQAVREEATGTYHVATGSDFAIGQVYDAVVDAMGKYGTDDPIFQPRAEDDAPTILLDPSATKATFGWEATTELDEGVNAAVAWYEEHGVTETFTHLAVKG